MAHRFPIRATLAILLGLTLPVAGCDRPGQKNSGNQPPSPAATPADAGSAHGHDPAAPPAAPNADAKLVSVPRVWQAIVAERRALEAAIAAGTLEKVHASAFRLRDLVALLPARSRLSAEATVRLGDATTRVAQLAQSLDAAGDAGNAVETAALATRMASVLDLVKGLYPPEEVPDPEYTCPMHPEVRAAAPGRCPSCGMSLKADVLALVKDHSDAHGHAHDAPHMDHTAKHGGHFGMQGDYHVELVAAATGELSLYLYDAWTKPLSVAGVRGTVALEIPAAGGGERSVEVALQADASGSILTARSPDVAAATAATASLVLPDTAFSITFPLK